MSSCSQKVHRNYNYFKKSLQIQKNFIFFKASRILGIFQRQFCYVSMFNYVSGQHTSLDIFDSESGKKLNSMFGTGKKAYKFLVQAIFIKFNYQTPNKSIVKFDLILIQIMQVTLGKLNVKLLFFYRKIR